VSWYGRYCMVQKHLTYHTVLRTKITFEKLTRRNELLKFQPQNIRFHVLCPQQEGGDSGVGGMLLILHKFYILIIRNYEHFQNNLSFISLECLPVYLNHGQIGGFLNDFRPGRSLSTVGREIFII
jgi:hypothetical protein